MPNMMDYLTWRGDLTLRQASWNLVDSLLMASLSYNPFQDTVSDPQGKTLRECAPLLGLENMTGGQYFQQWRALLFAMAESERFGGMRLHDYVNEVDEERIIQFSALTAEMEDGSTFVAFRGTDNTLVGWREDFHMSFETPVPAQVEALAYLRRQAERTERPCGWPGTARAATWPPMPRRICPPSSSGAS